MELRDPLTHQIIGAAIAVSKELGIGLLETVYESCLAHELRKRHMTVDVHPVLPVMYDGMQMEKAFRPDLIVEHQVVVEVKAITTLLPVHDAQLLNYLRLSRIRIGLLINFHAFPFARGIKRFIL